MGTNADSRTREPGLAEALARDLDPDAIVRCFAVNLLEDGSWHVTRFADSADANAYALTLPERSGRYVVGTSAPRRDVHPPLVADAPDSPAVATLANGERWEQRGNRWHMLGGEDYAPAAAENFASYADVIAADVARRERS